MDVNPNNLERIGLVRGSVLSMLPVEVLTILEDSLASPGDMDPDVAFDLPFNPSAVPPPVSKDMVE